LANLQFVSIQRRGLEILKSRINRTTRSQIFKLFSLLDGSCVWDVFTDDFSVVVGY